MEEKNKEATEEERPEEAMEEQGYSKPPKPSQEYLRKNLEKFNGELMDLLDKYNCKLTARLIIDEHKTVTQVFAVNNARS